MKSTLTSKGQITIPLGPKPNVSCNYLPDKHFVFPLSVFQNLVCVSEITVNGGRKVPKNSG